MNTTQPQLNSRQLAIIKLVCDGKAVKEIASELNMTYKSVESSLRNARLRLNCKNSAQLAVICVKRGWIEWEENTPIAA